MIVSSARWLGRGGLAAFLIAALTACQRQPPAAPAAPAAFPLKDHPISLESFHLENGLRVILIPNPRLPIATQMLWHQIGAADETPDKAGLAHYVEHLMFRDSRFGEAGFSALVAARGGESNAFTSTDQTVYFQHVAPRALEEAMRMEARRMARLEISEKDAEKERGVVLEERLQRVEASPAAMLREKMRAALYGTHPYARPVSGYPATIKNFTRADALRFHQRFYAPENALLLLSGDFSAEEARAMARRVYGALAARGEVSPPKAIPTPRKRFGKARVSHQDGRVRHQALSRVYLVPNAKDAPDDHAEALELLAEILGGGRVNRFYKTLLREEAVATGASAGLSTLRRGPGEFWLQAYPAPKRSLSELEKAMDLVIADVIQNGIGEEELAAAKRKLLAEWIYLRDRPKRLASLVGQALSAGLTPSRLNQWQRRVSAVKPETVRLVAGRYLREENSVSGVLAPLPQ